MKSTITISLLAILLSATLAGWWIDSAQGLESRFYKLYDIADSRGPVTRIGYAYYPDHKQLRVRVIVGTRIEAWGLYNDPATIEHMLWLIRQDRQGLFAVFKQDQLIALYRE